ncbi:ppsC [Symbiodinium microadriaticum]|nr:ppsC [Symbiodinium microadriaticum]
MASLPTVALLLGPETVAAAVAELGHVLPGDLVAIQAAAGGTGVLALAALRRRGAAVLATAGSARKQCFLRMRGVSRVTSSRSGDARLGPGKAKKFLRDALAGLPEHCLGADFLLNCLTHDDFIPRLSVLAPAGRFLELGKLRVWSSPSVQRFRSDVVHATMLLDTRVALAAVSLARELRSIAAAVEASLSRAHGSGTPAILVQAGELQLPPTSLFEFPGQALEAPALMAR